MLALGTMKRRPFASSRARWFDSSDASTASSTSLAVCAESNAISRAESLMPMRMSMLMTIPIRMRADARVRARRTSVSVGVGTVAM